VNLLSYGYFIFFVEWKTVHQLKNCLVHLLADENAYIDHSIVMVLSPKDKIIWAVLL